MKKEWYTYYIKTSAFHVWCFWLCCLVLAFISCDKSENITIEEEQTVFIKATAINASLSKSEADPVADSKPAVLSSGLLIFSKTDGTIGLIRKVEPGISGGDVVGITDLTSTQGAAIEGLKKIYSCVDFFGNLPSGVSAPAEDTNISDFIEQLQNFTVLADNSGGIENIGLYGKNMIDFSIKPYEVDIDVKPIASRLEIRQFELDPDYIKSFDIEGIFVNNFYYRADLTGGTDDDDIVYYFAGSAFEENGEPFYVSAYKGMTFDFDKNSYLGRFTGEFYNPQDNKKVWAYNIYSGEVPHIVIKFANVKASDTFLANNGLIEDPFDRKTYWYITITELINTGITLQKLEQGEVYVIENIKISALSPIPEPGDEVEVHIKVNLVPWIPVDASTTLPNLPW